MSQRSVPALIQAFLAAMQAGNRLLWRQADLALAIQRRDPHGLAQLERASGLSSSRLRELVRVARSYAAGQRYPLPFEHHTVALAAPRLFPAGSPEAQPAYWLQHAVVHHVTSRGLRRVMREHLVAQASPQQRRDRLQQLYQHAEQAHEALVAQLAAFNHIHAPYWGATLVLTETPVAAASA